MLHTFAPLLFVLIWSSGFLIGRGVAAHADPFWFLALRFALVCVVFTAAAWWARVEWPKGARRVGLHLLAGALMSGFYLGPSWWAMSQGMPAGIMALIGALQPLFDFIGCEPNPIPVKALLRHAGIGTGLRLPLTPLSLLNEGRLAPAAAAILAIESECRLTADSA